MLGLKILTQRKGKRKNRKFGNLGVLSILSHCNSSIGNEGGAINMGKVQGILRFLFLALGSINLLGM
jgi:hypothetical protein